MESWKRALGASVAAAAVSFAGCSKIYFHNGAEPAADIPPPEFHHVGVLGLVEFSPPQNLKEICGDKEWSAVLTQKTFVAGLVSGVTQQIYTPWAFSTGCK